MPPATARGRERRQAAVAAAQDLELCPDVDEQEEVQLPSPTERRSPRLADRPAPGRAVGCVAMRQTGLMEMITGPAAGSARPPATTKRNRKDGVWQYVQITHQDSLNGSKVWVSCQFCSCQPFQVSSVTRIIDHILGRTGTKGCTADSDEYHAAYQKVKDEEDAKQERKRRKHTLKSVSRAAEEEPIGKAGSTNKSSTSTQMPLVLNRCTPQDADDAVARFFFGNNISTNIVDSKSFKKLVQAIRCAPLDWKAQSSRTLRTKGLQDLTRKLRIEEAPLRQSVMRNCGTVLSDGWDAVDRSHLVNQLVGNSEGVFFCGTWELKSDDHEDADFVTSIFSSLIDSTGPLSIIQLCSDTCSVMKAAWRNIEKKYTWVTATPCGTHVLSLELKEMAKIAVVKDCMENVRTVLKLFWGRKRWPRMKLREVVAANHDGAKWGLYKAKPTRFAGRIREMARLLRAKNDLQEIVVSAEYVKRKTKFNSRGRTRNDDEDDDEEVLEENVGDTVRNILLDERDFWPTLVQILRVTIPIVKLLRKMDNNSPCMGSIYDHMFQVQERMEKMKEKIPWVVEASRVHSSRWEYLHSPMHAAAYALDPKYMEVAAGIDAHCQDGLFLVMERMCIRDVMMELKMDVSTLENLTKATREVNRNHPKVLSRVAQGEREFALYKRGAAPFNKPTVKVNATKMEPYAFWELYGQQVPIIQSVAQRVLAQVTSAFSAERNWSVYGDIKNSKRVALGHARADARVYCHEAIQLHEKLSEVHDCVDQSDSDESDFDSNHSEAESDFAEEPIEMLMC